MPRFTPREQQVLDLLAEGYGNAQIANELVLSKGGVEHHIEHIYSKLNLGRKLAEGYNPRVLAARWSLLKL